MLLSLAHLYNLWFLLSAQRPVVLFAINQHGCIEIQNKFAASVLQVYMFIGL